MYSILLISYFLITINSYSIDIHEKDFQLSIEKLLLINNQLYLGTVDSLYRLSTKTFNQTVSSLIFDRNSHWKILLEIDNQNLLLCRTSSQGLCQIFDQDLQLIINSSLPVVANDPINSTIGLIIPGKHLIYFGVTYTNDGAYRWQIPNIAGRSLNTSRFMKILSANDDDGISRDDLALRFMSRQQTTFIVQYIYSFYTKHYIYFLTNQPNDLGERIYLTKIVRFCRNSSNSIIRTYTEIPLICSNSDWIIKTGDLIRDEHNQEILIGHFTRKDGSGGTSVCSWNIRNDIDKAFEENYRRCYSMGIGQRGLAFIKPNEPCRKDDTWSIPTNEENLCPFIDNDRLPYPVGGIQPIVGQIIYENSMESSSTFQMYSFGSSIVLFQGLTNGTLKLGLFDYSVNINWFYSSVISTQSAILSNVLFDKTTATFFFASKSKIYRLSFESDCTSRLSCDECLSSSNNPLCGWCTMNQRCTLVNHCPSNFWQQETNQCIQILNAQPLKASVDNSQWINLTLSKLPQLEHNEIYQCIFKDKAMSAYTQAIKLDHNRLSCPTPSRNLSIENGAHSTVRLSLIKWPSNISIATVPEFTFYNCSFYSSCLTCREEIGCQWCSQRCSSMCIEPSTQCASFHLLNPLDIYILSGKSIDIPLNFHDLKIDNTKLECRLNETIYGKIHSNHICSFHHIPLIENENNQTIILTVYQNNIQIGHSILMFIYRCDLYESCDQCQLRDKCSWCQGRCSTKSCSINEQCTSLRIDDFTPKILSFNGQTILTIYLNENFQETIEDILVANISCLVMNKKVFSNKIQCQTGNVEKETKGLISIRFSKSIYILSKDMIEYRQTTIKSLHPTMVYELGGQILHLKGENLYLGNEQTIVIGNYRCLPIKQTLTNTISCRLPSILPGLYNLSLQIDQQIIPIKQFFKVTSNPIVQDIDPTVSFASGGRLITIRGTNFASAQTITVKFSYKQWNARLKISSNDILSRDDDSISSFYFRTPGLPSPSNDFPSPPFDVNFSIYFDNSIISLTNLIQFRYIPDVLLNISSIPPTLPYTGEELKLQVENLTEAASFADIQLFIGCSECKLKTFTSKGITCQPPTKLITNTAIILNNQQQPDDCTYFNSSIAPIRFRIGYREYLIGYLSYIRLNTSKISLITMISLILASCLLTIALLTLGIYLFIKIRKTKTTKQSSSSSSITNTQIDKPFWSTDTSASTCPYYQVYEQISSLSSHDNTLTRAPLLLCPYYQDKRSTPSIIEQLQFLPTISIENDQLKKLLFFHTYRNHYSRQSMELFYDLLNMKPFSQAFLDQLILNNSIDLIQSYIYLFRYTKENLQDFSSTRHIRFCKFFSTLFHQTKLDLIHRFHIFDDFLRFLIDLIDSSPCDEILNRSIRSLSSSTLLTNQITYQTFQLTIDYENFFRFHITVLDCDTIDQIKQKIIRYLNSHENTYRILDYEQLDLILPPLNICLCTNQVPILKNYLIHSTIYCQKKSSIKNEKKSNQFHLLKDNQLIHDQKLIEEKLIENKHHLQQIFIYFFQQIINGLDLFEPWSRDLNEQNPQILFQQYIQVVSDLIRRLNRLMLCRSTCPIIESCLNVIADGLEFVFDTKTEGQFSSDIEFLFMDEKKYFSSFDSKNFHFRSINSNFSTLSSFDIRSLTLADDYAIECLFKLYQFYELFSEPINQHIGENHVSVLLPVHHLLVQIRQLLKSDTTTLI